MAKTIGINVVPRPVAELSDQQIEQLVSFGKQEAELLDQLELAGATEDVSLAMQVARALCELRDQAAKVR